MKKQLAFGAGGILLLAAAVLCHVQVQAAVRGAGERCLTVLLPALYGYSMLAAFCIRSGGLQALAVGKYGMPVAAVLFSQVGGYPVGAQLVHEMRRAGDLSAAQERRLLCVCFGCGPGFLLGTVCKGMPAGITAWMLLSVMLPNLLLAPWFLRDCAVERRRGEAFSFAQGITAAADSAAAAMLRVTAMVLAFAAGMGILEGMGVFALLPERTAAGLRTVLEVSCVGDYLRAGGSLPGAAAMLGFGGLCVHLQAASICEGNFGWLRFWICRLVSAVLSGGICWVGVRFFFREAWAASLPGTGTALTTGSLLPGACLLVMAGMTMAKSWRLFEER